MFLPTFITAALVASASASKLYVSSYTGTITTLNLTHTNNTYHLAKISESNGCQRNASWIQMDPKNHNMFCVDEGIVVANGSISSFKVNEESGALTLVNRTATLAAPVNSILYTSPSGEQLLAVAHYTTALTIWRVDPATAHFTLQQTFNFTLDKPGPNADRQKVSHPHQVLLDPTNRYFVVPDLGGDVVRIFYIDPQTLEVSARPAIPVVPGSGPRHGRFHTPKHNITHYYLVTEIGNTLTSYNTVYLPNNGGLGMKPIMNSKTYGSANATAFAFNAAAEVNIARGGHELIVSNRNATFFQLANPDPKNSTKLPSDTLATFPLTPTADGKFSFGELTPAGGSFPRSFSENGDGSLIAVALQNTGRVVIYGSCKKTGKLGQEVLADFDGLGQVTSVVWGK